MPNPLNAGDLTAYLFMVATLVAALISSLIKPLLERIPAFSPASPNQAAHDAALQAINVALTTVGVLLVAALHGQVSTSNWPYLVVQIVAAAAGAHGVYTFVKKKTGGKPTQFHEQAGPALSADGTESPSAI